MARIKVVLPDADRQEIANQFMRDESNLRREIPGLKEDQRLAVDAVDAWWDTRETGFLNSFPVVTGAYSDEQKIILLLSVLKRRSGV